MNGKRFARLSISMTLALLILVGTLQITIDPLFQYHKPWFGLEPVITDERYQNAGVAKNFDYNNAIIGTSMSQNFRLSEVNDIFGGTTVKLTFSGSSFLDWTYILRMMQDNDSEIDNILINIDTSALGASSKELRHPLPEYLYDDNVFTDICYWFNFSIINDFSVGMIKKNIINDIPDYENAFCWDSKYKLGKTITLESYNMLLQKDPSQVFLSISREEYFRNQNENIKLISPYIDSMKNTDFVFFFSPYSMLYWYSNHDEETMRIIEDSYTDACQNLLSHSNVQIYLFTDKEMLEMISNLDNYKDSKHYGRPVSQAILNRIKTGAGRLTLENYNQELSEFFNYIENFNYDALFE